MIYFYFDIFRPLAVVAEPVKLKTAPVPQIQNYRLRLQTKKGAKLFNQKPKNNPENSFHNATLVAWMCIHIKQILSASECSSMYLY